MLPSDRPGRVQERSHLGHRWVTAQADRSLDDYAVHWLRDLGQLIGRRPAIFGHGLLLEAKKRRQPAL